MLKLRVTAYNKNTGDCVQNWTAKRETMDEILSLIRSIDNAVGKQFHEFAYHIWQEEDE